MGGFYKGNSDDKPHSKSEMRRLDVMKEADARQSWKLMEDERDRVADERDRLNEALMAERERSAKLLEALARIVSVGDAKYLSQELAKNAIAEYEAGK